LGQRKHHEGNNTSGVSNRINQGVRWDLKNQPNVQHQLYTKDSGANAKWRGGHDFGMTEALQEGGKKKKITTPLFVTQCQSISARGRCL